MITDAQTNKVYFVDVTEIPTTSREYFDFFERFEEKLKEMEVPYEKLNGCKDIWCRDFMPVQVEKKKFVQYRYYPDYLEGCDDIRTNPADVLRLLNPEKRGWTIDHTHIILDGGNVVKGENAVIMTDKVFSENYIQKGDEKAQDELVKKLAKILGVSVIIIPRDPFFYERHGDFKEVDDEYYGHADGMVRFVDTNTVLVNNYWLNCYPETFLQTLEEALRPFNLIKMPFDVEKGWAYINFLQVGKKVLIPAVADENDADYFQKQDMDARALKFFRETVFPANKGYTVEQINATEVLDNGGALNCITWNIEE